MQKFSKEYWDKNYSEPKTMDCIGNAKEHSRYLKAIFELDLIDISSIVDLGFGYGYLFQQMLKTFLPYKACGIEPSKYAFDKARARKLKPVESTNLSLYNESIEQWCHRPESARVNFDLGICTSVFQYLEQESLELVVSVLAKRIKYLYLTVPTDIELKRQISELEFHDTYAISRTRDFYKKIMSPYFTNISSRVWESKIYFDEKSTFFTDLLYRED